MHTKDEYINLVLPYRMQAVDVFNVAVRYLMAWKGSKDMEIYFNKKLSITGNSMAFTNPVVESGIIHSRALLEFLGIKSSPKSPSKLTQRNNKRNDDCVIEDFKGLRKITIDEALSPYGGPKDEAETALAFVINCANKGLAHTTYQPIVDEENLKYFDIASRGIPTLIINYFYTPLGLPPPNYKIRGNK